MAKLASDSHILFAFDSIELAAPYVEAIGKVAALLQDPRCLDRQAEVSGHADFYGGRLYNTALSVGRAQVVVDALVAAGVDPNRLAVTGKGKADPAAAERTREARSKNRRVVITIVNQEKKP